MLERLLQPLYGCGNMEIVLFTSGDIKFLPAGVVCGDCPVRLKVTDSGIVDTSELLVFFGANPSRHKVGRWIAELGKQNFQQDAPLIALLSWLVGDGFQNCQKQEFRNQVLWNVSIALDDSLVEANQLQQQSRLPHPNEGPPGYTTAERTTLYYHATKETVKNAGDPILFLSGSQDKAHVKSCNMFSGFYALPDNSSWLGLPLDRVHSIL